MAIWVYYCDACGGEYQFMEQDESSVPHRCPECLGPLTRLNSEEGPAKRSAWYVTDYKNGGSAPDLEP